MLLRIAALAVVLVLTASRAAPVSATLIVNGGFEVPDVGPTGVEIIFGSGPTGFGWTVGGNVEVAGELYPPLPGPAFEGGQFLDLNGVTVGAITQFFATTAGIEHRFPKPGVARSSRGLGSRAYAVTAPESVVVSV